MNTLILPLDILHELIFGFRDHWGEHSLSRVRSEPEPFFPKIVPKQIGELLQQHNPADKPIFQIFIYPTHAEIWSAEHWNLSASRKHHIIHNSKTAVMRENGVQLDAIKKCILAITPAYGDKVNEPRLNQMARALQHASKDVASLIPGLCEILYGKAQ